MSSVIPVAQPLGSLKLYEILVRKIFSAGLDVRESDIRTYCTSTYYRAGYQLDGALRLLSNIGVLEPVGHMFRPGIHFDSVSKSSNLGLSISERLINSLIDAGELSAIFTFGSMTLGSQKGEVYIHLSKIPLRHSGLFKLLRDLDVIQGVDKSGALLKAEPPFAELLVKSVMGTIIEIKPGKTLSPEQLEALLEERKIRGAAAEEFVFEYEQRRLHGHPRRDLIRRISVENVMAGYDIISFESTKSIIPDRFIEVKSFTGREHFYISSGEVKAAHTLQDSYFLYLVNADHIKEPDYEPKIIRNAYTSLFGELSEYVVETDVYFIEIKPPT